MARALSHAGRQSRQTSDVDHHSPTFPGASVRHRGHGCRHPARQWEKHGRRALSLGPEAV